MSALLSPGDPFFASLDIVAGSAWANASSLDRDGAFPVEEVALLAHHGLLAAPLPERLGGLGLGLTRATVDALFETLRILGAASLPLGRLFEGHVNAVKLVAAYGGAAQVDALATEIGAGALAGVWTAGGPMPLEPDGEGWVLRGRKPLASGAGQVGAPLTTARTPDGALWLVAPRLAPSEVASRTDLSTWTAHGMRASASGTVDFEGVKVGRAAMIGQPGDYLRQPLFSGGAWRVLAVQLGGIERVFDLHRQALRASGRDGDAVQRARLGESAVAVETARLWTRKAGQSAEDPAADAQAVAAYVNLARRAVEVAALAVIERAERGVGLAGFMRPEPLERVVRDLSTYLRQPFPDRAFEDAAAWLFAADLKPSTEWGRP